MPESHIVIPRQTHSTNVVTISTIPVAPIDDTDALVTTLSGITIGINTADCVPILLADGANHVIGAAHAGWKGTARRIAAATVGEMIKAGADPSCIKVIMGPCICAACFEVGDEVAETFRQSGFDLSRISFRNRVTGKIHIDLAQANRIVLMEAGIPPENISLPISCTRCRPDKYFSARRLGIHSGRIFTGLSLKR